MCWGRARGARETRGDGGSRVQGEQGGAVVRTQRYSINERTQCQSQISTPGHIQGFGIKHLPCFFITNGAKVIADDPARFSMQMTARWTAETALQTPRNIKLSIFGFCCSSAQTAGVSEAPIHLYAYTPIQLLEAPIHVCAYTPMRMSEDVQFYLQRCLKRAVLTVQLYIIRMLNRCGSSSVTLAPVVKKDGRRFSPDPCSQCRCQHGAPRAGPRAQNTRGRRLTVVCDDTGMALLL